MAGRRQPVSTLPAMAGAANQPGGTPNRCRSTAAAAMGGGGRTAYACVAAMAAALQQKQQPWLRRASLL
jgi:hypothetical protein